MLLPMQPLSDPASHPLSPPPLRLLSLEEVEEDERREEPGWQSFEELFSAGWIF